MNNVVVLPSGVEVNFPLEDDNFRKFRLTDKDGFTESPWFWMHPDDIADCKNDVNDSKVRYGVTANACLCGIPWGAVFLYTLNGATSPTVLMEDIIEWSDGTVIYHPECLAKIEKAKEKISNDESKIESTIEVLASGEGSV